MFLSFPKVNIPVNGIERVRLPEMVPIYQRFDREKVEHPVPFLRERVNERIPHNGNWTGKEIAITVGSRGIPQLQELVRTLCDVLKEWGARPFVVPAMGSHGGAAAEGQRSILAEYGLTEETLDVPIRSSMEVVEYGRLEGTPLYCDKAAFVSDGIVVFNKVKPHTEFRGDHESGLAKMIAIGLGNHQGASQFHSFGFERFPDLLPQVAEIFLKTGKLAFGVGVVQNAYDEINCIDVCTPDGLLEMDRRLLRRAKEKMGRLLFDHIDLLIIDEIGKNISGTGCDPNVVGRNLSGTFHGMLDLKKLFVRSITAESHHSGIGLGMADITTRDCLEQVDWEVTWANALTTGSMQGGRIPLYANDDRQAILQCLATCGRSDPERPRIVRIKNTLCLDKIQVSLPLYESIQNQPGIEWAGPPVPMCFDSNGRLQ